MRARRTRFWVLVTVCTLTEWPLGIPLSVAGEAVLGVGHASVAPSCAGKPVPCFSSETSLTPIQDAIDHVETVQPVGQRFVEIHPQVGNAVYEENLACDLPTGHTTLYAVRSEGAIQQMVRLRSGGVHVRGTGDSGPVLTASNCTVVGLTIEADAGGTAVATGTGDVLTVRLSRVSIQGNTGLIGPGNQVIRILNNAGFVIFDNVKAVAVCYASDSESHLVHFDSSGAPDPSARFRWEGGKIALEGACSPGAAAVALVDAYPKVEFTHLGIACEGSATCIEVDDDDVDKAEFTNVAIEPPLVAETHGRLLDIVNQDGGTSGSLLYMDGFAGLDASRFTLDSRVPLHWRMGANHQGTLTWSGDAGASGPVAIVGPHVTSSPGRECLVGHLFTNQTPDPHGAPGSLWVCEAADRVGDPGAPGAWVGPK